MYNHTFNMDVEPVLKAVNKARLELELGVMPRLRT
jgi:hypothetical protein